MATITLKGNPIHTSGDLPAVGSKAPAFTLVDDGLKEVSLSDFGGNAVVLNIFPSIDTGICAMSVRAFNEKVGDRKGTKVVNISMDLPFALKRFCGAEGIDHAVSLSAFRSSFADDYALKITDGPMAGLCSRAVLVLDGDGVVRYAEQVPEIAQEPDYDAALAALG